VITLYDYELSGNCYKVRLMLSILGVPYQKKGIEFYPAAQHKSDEFLALNPLGELPVIEEGDMVIRDSQAILVYLASRFDPAGSWYPSNCSERLAQTTQWLCFANSLTDTVSAARLADGFFYDLDADVCRKGAHKLLRILDEHLWFNELQNHQWIVKGDAPTIADIACFAYIMLSEEGGISRINYPAIRRWCDHVKRLPGFVVMPGIFPAGPAR